MGKSSRLRLSDVRSTHRLLWACRENGHTAASWRGVLAAGLPSLLGCQMVMVGEFDYSGPRPVPLSMTDFGWPTARNRAFWARWCQDPGLSDHPALARLVAQSRGTFVRRQLVPDREWDTSTHVNELLRTAGIDEGAVSLIPLGGHIRHLLTVCRAVGERPFARRERSLLHLIHTEVAAHLGQILSSSADPANRLTPRLRQTLEGLLGGGPEKQIARDLGVTSETLHGYVKQIYVAFGVRSRSELMAWFLNRSRPGQENKN